MNNKKNNLMIGLIYLVVFLAYNLAVFMIFENYNNVFFISYLFMLLAFVLHIICVFSIVDNASRETVFFGIPLLSLSVYFVCAEFFSSLVFMIFKDITNVKTAIFIQVLLLCAFIVIVILSIMSRDVVQNVDAKIKENVNFIKGINVDIEMLIQRSKLSEVTVALKKLSETIKYSDPMSNEVVAIQEKMIMQNMMKIRTEFDAGDMEKTKELCSEIELLFIERNKKLMISK